MSTAADAPPLPEGPGARPKERRLPQDLRRLFRFAPFAAAAAPIAYGIASYFMAIQVQLFDANAKVEGLALINTLSALAAMVAQPVFGVLSDRTRSRWGSRHPWMLAGAAIGVVALLTAGLARTSRC